MTTRIKSVRPTYDGVLVRPLSEESRTKGGLFIPEVHHGNKPYARGEVVAVGMGRPTDSGSTVPLQVKKGDIVLFNRSAGVVFPVEGEHLTLMPEGGIFAILEVEESPLIYTDSTIKGPMPAVMSLSWENDE